MKADLITFLISVLLLTTTSSFELNTSSHKIQKIENIKKTLDEIEQYKSIISKKKIINFDYLKNDYRVPLIGMCLCGILLFILMTISAKSLQNSKQSQNLAIKENNIKDIVIGPNVSAYSYSFQNNLTIRDNNFEEDQGNIKNELSLNLSYDDRNNIETIIDSLY